MSANNIVVPSHLSGSSDLAFRTEDGQVMTIEGFYLKASSQVIRDMLVSSDLVSHSITNIKPPSQSTIDLPFHSSVVQLYFDIVKLGPLPVLSTVTSQFPKDHPYHGSKSGGSFYCSMLDLMDFLDCAISHRERAIALFEPLYASDPWGVFCAAAKREDMAMAKKALCWLVRLSAADMARIDPAMMDPVEAARLPLGWLLGYQRAVFAAHTVLTKEDPHLSPAGSTTPLFWANVSGHFAVQSAATSSPTPFSNSFWNVQRAAQLFLVGCPNAEKFAFGLVNGVMLSLLVWLLTKLGWWMFCRILAFIWGLRVNVYAWVWSYKWWGILVTLVLLRAAFVIRREIKMTER